MASRFYASLIFYMAIPSEVVVLVYYIQNPVLQTLYALGILYTTYLGWRVMVNK